MIRILCFHDPDGPDGYLSNWYPCRFMVDGFAYTSMEQYLMYQKARLFGDIKTAAAVVNTEDMALIKKMGRQIQEYDEVLWNGMRQILVYRGLLAKFSQNEDLKYHLLKTYPCILAECSVSDRIWATGLSMTDPARLDMSQWKGQNLLGFALMQVRSRLMRPKTDLTA